FGREVGLRDHHRRHRGDLHGDVPRELAELGVARDEVRLAGELHQGADAPAGMDVRLDDALAGVPVGTLGGRGKTLLPEQVAGPLEVALRLLESALAIHDAGAGLGAELLNGLAVDHGSVLFTMVVLRGAGRGATGAAAAAPAAGAAAAGSSAGTAASAGAA